MRTFSSLLPLLRLASGSLVLLGVLASAGVWAQESPPRMLSLDRWSGYFGLAYELEDGSRETAISDLEETTHRFEEILGLRARGSIYHTRFMTFRLDGEVTFEQEDVDGNGNLRGQDSDSTDLEFRSGVTFLRKHPYTLELYANRSNIETRRSFFQTTEVTTETLGANLQLKMRMLPTWVRYSHSTIEGDGFTLTDEERDTLIVESRRDLQWTNTQLRYEYGDVDIRSTQQAYQINNALASVRHRWGEGEHSVSVSAQRREQRGTLDTDNSLARGTLGLQLREDLQGRIDAFHQANTTSGANNRSTTLGSSLTHQLYRSLTSTAGVAVASSSFEGGGNDSWRGYGVLDYRKEVPIGQLDLDFRYEYLQQDEDSDGQIGTIIGERQVFTFGTPIFLLRRLVIASTVVISDATGATLFLENVDYVVTPQGDLTRIEITPGSAILDGQELSIDYDFQQRPDRTFNRVSSAVGAALWMGEHWRVYGNYSSESEDLVSGIGENDLRSSRRGRFGVQYSARNGVVNLYYEDFDATFNAFERYQISGNLNHRTRHRYSLLGAVSGTYYRVRFLEDNQWEEGASLGLSVRSNFSRNLELRASTQTRFIDDRVDRGFGVFAEAGARYRYNKYDFSLVVRETLNEFAIAADSEDFYLYFRVVRNF